MAQTTPPTITAAPAYAPVRNDRSTFSNRLDAFVTWLYTAVAQFAAVATNVYNNAVDAYNSAVAAASSVTAAGVQATNAAASASAAAATANVSLWVSGTTYALGVNVFSPIDYKTYRRKVAGAGTTDPSSDSTNWQALSGDIPGLKLLATLTPTASAAADFLTSFNASYDGYFVDGSDIKCSSASDSLLIRFANAGVLDTANNYFETAISGPDSTASSSGQLTGNFASAGRGGSFTMNVQNVNSSAGLKVATCVAVHQGGASEASGGLKGVAYFGGAVSGIRFYWSGGSNFAAQGTIRIYGYSKT